MTAVEFPRIVDPDPSIERALVIVAHPDDAEFGVGGTVARLTAAGVDVRYVVATNGGCGSKDPTMTRERLTKIRRREQEVACEILGVEEVIWLGHPDGYLEPILPVRRQIAAEIRRHRPQLVITMDPVSRWHPEGYVNHPDHRAVGDLVLDCINPAASTRLWDPTLLDEGLAAHNVDHLWLMGFRFGPHRIDISDHVAVKVEALRAHRSQLEDSDPDELVREWMGWLGREVGVAYAEAFTMLALG